MPAAGGEEGVVRAAREAEVGVMVASGDWGRMAGVRAIPGRARVWVQGLCGEVKMLVLVLVVIRVLGFMGLARSLASQKGERGWKRKKGKERKGEKGKINKPICNSKC